jgi:uncharacterized FlaG/YvyC family protein
MVNGKEWSEVTDEYLGTCEEAFEDWENEVTTGSKIVSSVMNDTAGEVDKVTEASENLADELDKVIPDLEKEMDQIRKSIGFYADKRDAIKDTIEEYENLLEIINAVIKAEAI